jgi:hypothetical protein
VVSKKGMDESNLFRGYGVEVTFAEPNDFLKIRETLTRIGIASKQSRTLNQSCHLLHKKGRYAIMHFKEMFALDGKQTNFSDEDKARRNTIAALLQEWKLLTVVNPEQIKEPTTTLSNIKIISFKDKKNWTLVSKYQIGAKK